MASWSEFANAAGGEFADAADAGAAPRWLPGEPGLAAEIAAAGARLFERSVIALLATVSPSGRPRVHPFVPKIVDGRLWAFIGPQPLKRRNLERGWYTIHAVPGAEDEEFWVSGRAHFPDGVAARRRVAEAMPWAVSDAESLCEFDVDFAGWTTWVGFGTPLLRPVLRRWRAP